MQKYILLLLLLLSPLCIRTFTDSSSEAANELYNIKKDKFGALKVPLSIFSYAQDETTKKALDKLGITPFTQADFDTWKKACNAAANRWIYNHEAPEEQKEYENCKNLTSELTLALAVIEQQKYRLTNNMEMIRKTLEPVVQAAKRMKGSLFKRFKGAFKKEDAAMRVVSAIKDILEQRVKEVFDDFNDKLKSSVTKNVKKLSF